MRWILLGPPGSGKGTQAKKLASSYNAAHISTGEMLRAEIAAGSPLGQKARQYMDRGDLVPDGVILEMIRERLTGLNGGRRFVLDGFPRTTEQADGLRRMLEEMDLSLDRVVLVEVSDEEIHKRLCGRARLEGRSDDAHQVVARRLEVYRNQTAPLVAYYEQLGLLAHVNGEQSIESVFGALQELARDRETNDRGEN